LPENPWSAHAFADDIERKIHLQNVGRHFLKPMILCGGANGADAADRPAMQPGPESDRPLSRVDRLSETDAANPAGTGRSCSPVVKKYSDSLALADRYAIIRHRGHDVPDQLRSHKATDL
jgi:hypothetical protein